MGYFFELALTPTACQFLLGSEVLDDSWQVISAEPKGLCSLRKKALRSTDNGEVTLRSQSGRTVLDKFLGNKRSKTNLWLQPPGKGWWGHICFFVTHEDTDMWLARWLLETDFNSIAVQTSECEPVFRAISVTLLSLFLPPYILSIRPCSAVSCLQTLLRKQSSGTSILDIQDSEKYTCLIEATQSIKFCYENQKAN